MTDRFLLTIRDAAALAGVDRHTFGAWLREDERLRAAVVVSLPGRRTRISRPRLEQYLGAEVKAS